jgi:hypothetical protein
LSTDFSDAPLLGNDRHPLVPVDFFESDDYEYAGDDVMDAPL